MINYDGLEREVSWMKVDSTTFDGLWSSALPQVRLTCRVAFGGGRYLVVEVDRPEYLRTLGQKFDVERLDGAAGGAAQLRYVEELVGRSINVGGLAPGLIEAGSDRCLVVGSGPGKLKSLVSSLAGFYSEDDVALPLHAAVLRSGDRGVALVGGRGAGKTTNTFRLALGGDEWQPMCDDWSSVRHEGGVPIARAVDRSVSYTADILNEFGLTAPITHDAGLAKNSAAAELIFPGMDAVESVAIDTFVGLTPSISDGSLVRVDARSMAKHAIVSAYHYPYLTWEQIDEHETRWETFLGECSCYFFATRSPSGGFNNLSLI